ncbi:MAG: class I SAM-dependent methyltransferase [Methanobacteriota archaeon]|nr:MAG: class I SAM-dependent methyltransferase [Euryarchaeota archaeon]
MARYFLNREVVYKSKETFSCIYHRATGWYYPCKPDLWATLQSYRGGREVDPRRMTPALAELAENRFIIQRKAPGPEDYLDLYPVQVPGTVYIDRDGSIDVAVERKGAHGEIDFDVKRLEGVEAGLWRLCDGTGTLREIAKELQTDGETLLRTMREWTSIENQMARLLARPMKKGEPLPNQLIYKAPFLPRKKDLSEGSAEDVRAYHLKGITDGAVQFDRVESTLSHLYRVPHPILNGQSYGQALLRRIEEDTPIAQGMRILEVGGGLGNISRDIMAELKERGVEAEYLIYDLSPALIRSQRELHRKSGVKALHIHGNGEALALKDSTVDIAISNEAIADFHTPEAETAHVEEMLSRQGIPVTEEFHYWYREAPRRVRLNLGAFQLLKELYRVLRPGGTAVITEYGHQDRLPYRARHLDHPEYTIHFGQMISVATALGFDVTLTDAWDYLGFREDTPLMTHFSYMAALRLREAQGKTLPNITYTEGLFREEVGREAESYRGIRYVPPIKDPFKIVKVLVCRKPRPHASVER